MDPIFYIEKPVPYYNRRPFAEDSSAYCTLADQISMTSGGCRSGWDLPIRVFLLFFSISIFERLAVNTNLYAAS